MDAYIVCWLGVALQMTQNKTKKHKSRSKEIVRELWTRRGRKELKSVRRHVQFQEKAFRNSGRTHIKIDRSML